MRVFVAVVGPTAAGKSDLALDLAKELGGEIVSCDALQVYRGLDVGTAKLSIAERRDIPHYLIDEVGPDEDFSAAEYVARAVPTIEDISARGRLPIVVGGTGLYLRALRSGLFPGPGRSTEIRERLARIAARRGTPALHRILRRWDPPLAGRIHPNDRIRLMRGIEVFLQSGERMSDLMGSRRGPLSGFQDRLVGLRPDREVLRSRVEARVSSMFSRGFVEEVRRLRDGYGAGAPAFKAIGYREVALSLEGEMDVDEAMRVVSLLTVQYAKRQMTWFRREPGIRWFDGCGDDETLRGEAKDYVRRQLPESGGRQNAESWHAETAP